MRPKWLLPQRATLWALPVHYKDLWKIRAPVEYTEGFNLQPFDDLIMVSLGTSFYFFPFSVLRGHPLSTTASGAGDLISFVNVYAGQGRGGGQMSCGYNFADVLFGCPLMKSEIVLVKFTISAPICQNTFSPHLVKNEFRVFSESLGPPPSSTQTLVAIAGL